MPLDLFSIGNNQFLTAGLGVLGAGAGLAVMRKGFQMALVHFRRMMLVSVEIPSKDKSFHWVLEWISSREGPRTQHVSVDTTIVQQESGQISTKIQFTPSVGTHYMIYKGRVIKVDRVREKSVVDMSSGNLWEAITLTTMGRKREIFQRIIEEARIQAQGKEEGKTVIMTSSGTSWTRFGHPRKKRPLHSVILDEGLGFKILNDVKEFLLSANWYIDRGIPYRRGYLLYGPPGCGKSSFITALAGELQLSICILSLGGKNITDTTLSQLLSSVPQRSVILLEDVDAAIKSTDHARDNMSISSSGTGGQTLTFSGLLNALDGVGASEGRVLFMTTNYIERLDPALIRPGRVDFKAEIGLASSSQIRDMFLKFFPECAGKPEIYEAFTSIVPPKKLSMAQLQAFFMTNKTFEQAMESVHKLKEMA